MPDGLPFRYTDYLELVVWTVRILRDDKRGEIPAHEINSSQILDFDDFQSFSETHPKFGSK